MNEEMKQCVWLCKREETDRKLASEQVSFTELLPLFLELKNPEFPSSQG